MDSNRADGASEKETRERLQRAGEGAEAPEAGAGAARRARNPGAASRNRQGVREGAPSLAVIETRPMQRLPR